MKRKSGNVSLLSLDSFDGYRVVLFMFDSLAHSILADHKLNGARMWYICDLCSKREGYLFVHAVFVMDSREIVKPRNYWIIWHVCVKCWGQITSLSEHYGNKSLWYIGTSSFVPVLGAKNKKGSKIKQCKKLHADFACTDGSEMGWYGEMKLVK